VRQIHESGFKDSNLFANFVGEREDLNPKAKDSNLCCQVKRTQNCSNRPNLVIWMNFSNYLRIYEVFYVYLNSLMFFLNDKSFYDFWDSDSNPDLCESFSKSSKDSLGFESQI
jgi:hypothetical protein